MDEMDVRLQEAGRAWQATLTPAGQVDPAWFDDRSDPGRWLRPLILGGAFAIVLAVALAGFGGWPDPGPSSVGTGSRDECPVTRPDPPFVPPVGVAPATAPSGAVWFGSASLWTALDPDGESWTDLPRSGSGFDQKTFWWSAARNPRLEKQPAIQVVGTRLDGEGSFAAGPGTNASADDLGSAMLVGIVIPDHGCWELVGQYRDATLRYVVWVGDE